MGTLVGHVAPGFGFFVIGLWHLLNHIKLHAQSPSTYTSLAWFPTSKMRYLELYLIMFGCIASISMELFIGPDRHQPFDPDGTIPSNHLHNFEHSAISLAFFTYAAFAIILDKVKPKAEYALLQVLGAVAFAQQLLLFRLHSTDHTSVEGQYHSLLQLVICVSLATTLLGINYRKSFINSFVRSASIVFQGLWFMVMGFMLWTPQLMFKGCHMNMEEGHLVERCDGDKYVHRAKALVNLQFSFFLILVTIFSTTLYLFLDKFYGEKVEYQTLTKEDEEEVDDVESQTKNKLLDDSKSFIHIGKAFGPTDLER
ncbi:Protein of unknown function DUF716 [Dillenia turbinata]|uniref:Uncharacterized protein n=1 Tax=Dillenia turbinata TaxID=194707 RepID=A0AAN8VZC3_9MAGN